MALNRHLCQWQWPVGLTAVVEENADQGGELQLADAQRAVSVQDEVGNAVQQRDANSGREVLW